MFDAFLATTLFSGADLGLGRRVDWVVSQPPPFRGAKKKKKKKKQVEKGCECYGRNKGKRS